jgi:hypothetical protein
MCENIAMNSVVGGGDKFWAARDQEILVRLGKIPHDFSLPPLLGDFFGPSQKSKMKMVKF